MLKRKRNDVVHHLLSRSICSRKQSSYSRNRSRHHFSSLTPLLFYDTNQLPNEEAVNLSALETSSPITELVVAGHIIFALAAGGACAAFSRISNKRLCYLNIKSDETIRSIFWNKANNSIITVSVYKKDEFRQLRCRSTAFEHIESQQPELGFPIFVSESLKYPGFIEFDDSNSKVLTYSAVQSQYKVWDLLNYDLMYCITDPNITEIKMSPGIMLLIYRGRYSDVPLKMLEINHGTLLHDISCPVVPRKPVEFVEQSNGKILMKQLGTNLTIYDVETKVLQKVENFSEPSAFIFLYINRLFLTFRGTTVSAWNFEGKKATTFADHELFTNEASTNNNFISEDQHLLISYCKNKTKGRSKGSLNISHCVTGELIHKLDAKCNTSSSGSSSSSSNNSSIMVCNNEPDLELVDMSNEVEEGEVENRSRAMTVISLSSSSTNDDEPSTYPARPLNYSAASTSTLSNDENKKQEDEDEVRNQALDGVTAIFFNNDYSEIYTGNNKGQVWVWGH